MSALAHDGDDFSDSPCAPADSEPEADVVDRHGEEVIQGDLAVVSGKAKAKAKGKGKAKAKASAGKGACKGHGRRAAREACMAESQAQGVQTESDSSWRKCITCDEYLLVTFFNDRMSKCKFCFNDKRAFDRLVALSPEADTVRHMERKTPGEHKKMFKAYVKEREQRVSEFANVKWSVVAYMEEFLSASGSRLDHVGEFMWEGEYMEWAKTAKAGHLSADERKANWKQWEKTLSVPRDRCGPRNSLRLWVHTADRLTRFEEISKIKHLQREEKIKKNTSAEILRRKLAMVFTDDIPETHDLADVRGQDLINFPALQDRAAKVMTGDGRSSALDGCLLGPDIEDIMQRARVKKTGGSPVCRPVPQSQES